MSADGRRRRREPRDLAAAVEAAPTLPAGDHERFSGYGVMGLPFRSGHLLAMRRFPASSVGPGYRSVWHRDPEGQWTFFQDVAAEHACTRYFGSAVADVQTAEIAIDWHGPRALSVVAISPEHRLEWSVVLTSSPLTRMMNAVGPRLPDAAWHHPRLLAAVGAVAGPLLRAGEISLAGDAPSGHRFVVNPMAIWLVGSSDARLDGVGLGAIGAAPAAGRLGDFRIPQRGMFAVGRAFFEAPAGRGAG